MDDFHLLNMKDIGSFSPHKYERLWRIVRLPRFENVNNFHLTRMREFG